ncbi:MAG: fatty acid desaturase [Gemmataceae bacterium]|nr:fatty acid desaturase [Gemmata sp.]MDW8198380.1 fatty acid desaturase [Gemmataceae bacterium]
MSTVPAPVSASADSVPPTVSHPTAPPKRIFWFYATIILIHAVAILAFIPGYTLVWWGLPVVLVGNFIFGSLGINLGYHRMLTHSAARFPKPLERLWVLLGVCSMEGSPLWWVCTHRMHHQHSDEEGDPHSPQQRFFWGHMEWIYTADPRRQKLETYARYVPDLMGDKFLRWLHKGEKWLWVWAGHVVVLTALGFAAGFLFCDTPDAALLFGVQWFLWAVVVRTVYVWHITWLVNSAAHRWGYRNYNTNDASRNNWFVALLTNGEGWHNNHHAAPRACSQGHRWWEIDLTFTFVRLLQRMGLAWDVVEVKVPKHIAAPSPTTSRSSSADTAEPPQRCR